MSDVFLNTHLYSRLEIFLYVGGFLAWTPAYVTIIVRGIRRKELEMPIVAVIGNLTWELLWGFFYRVDMGWGLQGVYIGAFILDLGIFAVLLRYGYKQIRTPEVRRYFPLFVGMLAAGWLLFYATLRREGYDLPLGSNSAYLDNLEMSALYFWAGCTLVDPRRLSPVVAWSKFLGTLMVTGFVFLQYPDNSFVHALAVMGGILDVAYIVVLTRRLRHSRLAHDPELEVRARATVAAT